jgi:hypothetical protein
MDLARSICKGSANLEWQGVIMKEMTLLIVTIFAISTLIFGVVGSWNYSLDDLPRTPYKSVYEMDKVYD